MSLYRTDEDSRIIKALVRAAECRKQVACVVELQARFDEERNIQWAQKLESSGVHVIYGVLGLKTHAKMALVVRKESSEIRTYVHIGTGNYNAATSRFYTDLGLLTAKKSIAVDAMEVFNYLTGHSLKDEYPKLVVAPKSMKRKVLSAIKRETTHARQGKPARIVAKMNQLEDPDVIQALYTASNTGVSVDLIVRGFCCLRPGIKGLSENIRVISIVGQFLEHSRIFYFSMGHEDPSKGKYLIGSADWMGRNLERRVEVLVPIEGQREKSYLWKILDANLRDEKLSWSMDKNGRYRRHRNFQKKSAFSSQDFLKEDAILS